MTFLCKIIVAAAALMCAGLGEPARADFIDNFNSENGGSGALNYSNFANWTVTNGTVDLIGNGFFDFYPGNGLYVDLDGSSGLAGTMTTKMTFAPGTYTLSFDLGGSQRGDTNLVDVSLGNYSEQFTELSSDPLALVSRTVTLAAPAQLVFHNEGGDNLGAILDNVSVVANTTPVPEPAAVALAFMGVLSLIATGSCRRISGFAKA